MFNRHGLAIGIILFVLLMTPVTAYLVYQNQNPQSKASVAGGTATLSVSPTTMNLAVGETKPVKLFFDTNGKAINGVQAILKYQFSGSSPQVAASNLIMNQTFRNASNGDWACGILNVDVTAPNVKIEVTCTNSSLTGYTSVGATEFAAFDLTAKSAPGTNPFQISFDSANSYIYEKVAGSTTAVDILQAPTSSLAVTVGAQGSQAPTPTPTPAPESSHKVCINSACAVMAGAGSNECASVGASCTQTFSQVAATECNGKYDPNCYNCVDDSAINILDFACFGSAYGKQRTTGVNWQ